MTCASGKAPARSPTASAAASASRSRRSATGHVTLALARAPDESERGFAVALGEQRGQLGLALQCQGKERRVRPRPFDRSLPVRCAARSSCAPARG